VMMLRRTSAKIASLAAAGLAAVAVIALSASLAPSAAGRTSLLQTHQVLGFKPQQAPATASEKKANLIRQWAKNPALAKLMRHALAKDGAKTVHRFVSKIGADLTKHADGEKESVDQIEHDFQSAGLDAEKSELAYEAICHQEMAEFETEMHANDLSHPPADETEEEFGMKLATAVLFTHIDKDESGCIDPQEFEEFVHELQQHLPEEVCENELKQLCKDLEDDDGFPDAAKIDAEFYHIDTDGSGFLSLNEVSDLVHHVLAENGVMDE